MRNCLFLTTILLAPLLSCGGPGDNRRPNIDAEAAAAKALKSFDKNSDGFLNDDELQSAPGLAEGKSRADTDSDGKISTEELSARIQTWNNSKERIVCPELQVRFNGRIVPNASITFEPEPFLAEWLENDQTRTKELGRCTPQISRELPGMNMGYYRVKVSKEVGGKERIPKEYNEQTQIGVEFCTDRPIEEHFLIPIELETTKRRR